MNPLIALLLRNGLMFLAGILVQKGYLSADQVDSWVTGTTSIILGLAAGSIAVAFSVFDKIWNSIFKLNGAPKPVAKIDEAVRASKK